MIDKLAIALLSPLGTAMLLLLMAALAIRLKWHRWALALVVLALGWLWLWSTPAVSRLAMHTLESAHLPVPVQSLPRADAIVVLGGAVSPPTPQRPYTELHASSDRLWHAARLWHAGKAPVLVLSGGAGFSPGAMPEAQAMQQVLRDLQVPDHAMLLETRSINTRQNALFSAELLFARAGRAPRAAAPAGAEMPHILLVTSASHMARASANFAAAGMRVTPAATDYETLVPVDDLQLVPSAGALDISGRAFKEWAGRFFAQIRPSGPAAPEASLQR